MQSKTSYFPYIFLPLYLQQSFLLYNDIRTILAVLSLTKSTKALQNSELWTKLIIRDFPFYLITKPLDPSFSKLTPNDLKTSPNPIKTIPLSPEEAILEYNEDYKLRLSLLEKLFLNQLQGSITGSKALYLEYYKRKKDSLEGLWIGDYIKHGNEKIKLLQRGYEILAIKVTGDNNVPAKKMTWRIILKEESDYGRGCIVLAEEGFKKPKLDTLELQILNNNKIIINAFTKIEENWIRISLGCTRIKIGNETPFMSAKFEFFN